MRHEPFSGKTGSNHAISKIPTCPLQNTKSPFLASVNLTLLPTDSSCISVSLGQFTPQAFKASWTKPEQSIPFLEPPPHRYGEFNSKREVTT